MFAPHVEVRQALPGLRGSRAASSSVSRSLGNLLPRLDPRAAPGDELVHDLLEVIDRGLRLHAPEPGQSHSWQAEDVHRVDGADRDRTGAFSARPSASGSRWRPWVKIVRSSTSSVSRVVSMAMSTVAPVTAREPAGEAVRRERHRLAEGRGPCGRRTSGPASGAACASSSPSAVNRPGPMTRFRQRVLAGSSPRFSTSTRRMPRGSLSTITRPSTPLP